MAVCNAHVILEKWVQIYQLVNSLTKMILQYERLLGLLYVKQKLYGFKKKNVSIQTIWIYNLDVLKEIMQNGT